MKRSKLNLRARRELDRKFQSSSFKEFNIPRRGWIRAIREALGMSQEVLAHRLRVSGAAVAKLEKAELNGGITLTKLREVAASLDCHLEYAIVPNTSLEATVRGQALKVAYEAFKYTDTTMALEDQGIDKIRRSELQQDYINQLIESGKVWNKEPELRLSQETPGR